MTKSSREAFTLVELLVVITIIGMLMAMILPAVTAIKEHARQITCINNQSEIAKAMLSFESRRGRFPGFVEEVKLTNADETSSLAWPVVLLPELGRRDLYDAMLIEGSSTSLRPPPNSARSYVENLVCPSAQMDKDGDRLSYVVNAGRRDSGTPADTPANGVFHNRAERISNPVEVTTSTLTRGDGMANTLMISERLNVLNWGRRIPSERWQCFIWWPTMDPAFGSRINEDKESTKWTDVLARPASNHPGGVIVAFCDASAQFLRDDIDYRVHIQLMTPNHRRATIDRNGNPLPPELRDFILKEQDY